MKILITILCVLMGGVNLYAAGNEKKYEKRYPKEGIEELVLSSEYGQIYIEQTEGDEIIVDVTMSVTAKTDAKAEETLEYIQTKGVQSGAILTIATEFGKDMAIRQFISSTTLNIDYQVRLPKGIKLRLISSNGNVFLGDFEGEINADLRNGNFQAHTVKGEECYIKQDKGNFDITDVQTLIGDFKNCQLSIESGTNVKLTTNSCDGKLESLDKLNIRSSGGTMKLGDIEELTGSSSFTKYEVQDLGNILDMDMKMGEMNVRNIHVAFSEIRLKGSFTKVGLTFMSDAGYHLELKRNKSLKTDLPRGTKLEERPTTERNMVIGTKFFGNPQYGGKVYLELSNGSLYIQ